MILQDDLTNWEDSLSLSAYLVPLHQECAHIFAFILIVAEGERGENPRGMI